MKERANFEGPKIDLRITRPSAPSVIEVRLTENGIDHPISGFPRCVVPDKDLHPMKRYNTIDSKDSNARIARARRRRGARTSHVVAEPTDTYSNMGSPRSMTSPRIPSSVRRVSDNDRPARSTPDLTEHQSYESMPSLAEAAYPPPPTRPPPKPLQILGDPNDAAAIGVDEDEIRRVREMGRRGMRSPMSPGEN